MENDYDVSIEDDFVEDDEFEEEVLDEEISDEKTINDLLPTNCIVLAIEEGSVEPLISVRGKYQDLGEALALLRFVTSRVQYIKYVQERS